MGRLSTFDQAALSRLLARQHGVVSRDQTVACAMTPGALRHRLRPDGPWQAVLPGVYLTNRGDLSPRQRAAAAFLFGGPGIAVTGAAALTWHGIRQQHDDLVDVLVGLSCYRQGTGFVRLHRTGVMPNVGCWDGAICYAPAARAVADAVRQLREPREIRAIVAAGVQRGKVAVWQLAEQLDEGPRRGSAGLRQALAEVAEGARSAAEAELVALIKRARLPMPLLNPRLLAGGEFLAIPDTYWPGAGVAAEVDSREYHFAASDWERTLARHARMSACGIIVLHYPPSRIRTAGREVVAEIRAALEASRGRRLPQVQVQPAC
jgi:hypothetical protein